jgi:hypothetical protein
VPPWPLVCPSGLFVVIGFELPAARRSPLRRRLAVVALYDVVVVVVALVVVAVAVVGVVVYAVVVVGIVVIVAVGGVVVGVGVGIIVATVVVVAVLDLQPHEHRELCTVASRVNETKRRESKPINIQKRYKSLRHES